MTHSVKRQVHATYQLRVDGHLDQHWSLWFGDLTLTHEDNGTTSLTGVIADQAELHGLLTKIRDLGVTLISLAVVDPSDSVGMRTESSVRRRLSTSGTPEEKSMLTPATVASPADTKTK